MVESKKNRDKKKRTPNKKTGNNITHNKKADKDIRIKKELIETVVQTHQEEIIKKKT